MTDALSDNLSLTAEIVAAYVSNNAIAPADLPKLISSVFTSLSSIDQAEVVAAERPEPAVPIRKSVTDGFIVCLEDGKKLKMLKRYLQTRYGMTPDAYRQRWDLPHDYPMVAPAYASQRSEIAKQIGLGRKPAPAPVPELVPEPELAPEPTPVPESIVAKRRSGGRKKVA